MDLHEAILSRRTIKDFLPKPVPDDLLDRALTAGLWAQNHKLTQPWRFTILGPETRAALADKTGETKVLSKPAIVAVSCLVSGDEHRQWEDECAVACAIAWPGRSTPSSTRAAGAARSASSTTCPIRCPSR